MNYSITPINLQLSLIWLFYHPSYTQLSFTAHKSVYGARTQLEIL